MKKILIVISLMLALPVVCFAAEAFTPMESPDDLADKRIGVITGSAQDFYATAAYPAAFISRFTNNADSIAALKADRIDAVMDVQILLEEILEKEPSLAFLSTGLNPADVGVAFKKGDEDTLAAFNEFLAGIRADGTLDDMSRRYREEGLLDMPDISNTGKNGKLVYGTFIDSSPYYVTLKDGEFAGFEIELAYRFAAFLEKELIIREMEFAGLIASLATGKVDMIGGGLAITEERQKAVSFSEPVYEEHTAILTTKDKLAVTTTPASGWDDDDIVSPEALAAVSGKTVGAMTGSNSAIALDAQAPDAALRHYDNIVDAVLALKTGRVDYVLTSTTSAKRFVYQDDSLEIVPDVVVIRRAPCIGVSKDRPELRGQIDGAIDALRERGVLEELERRWIRFDGSPYEPADIPPLTEGPVLRVAFASSSEPMSFQDANGNPAGFDADLARYIARELGMRIEFIDLSFAAMVASVQSGKADIAISNISATAERKKALDFTQEYFFNPQVLLRLKTAPGTAASGFMRKLGDSFYSNILLERRYMLILNGLGVTVSVSIISLIFGTALGGVICALRMSQGRVSRGFAKGYISLLRGLPVLVVLMIIYYVVFASVSISPYLVSMLAFGMNFAAYAAEIFRTGIEGVDPGQWEAGVAGGFTPAQTFLYIILPQAVRRILPVYRGEFVSMVKMTSIVGYIAVQDLTKAGDIIRSRTMEAFFPLIMVAVLYFFTSWALIRVLSWVERRADPRSITKRRAGA